MGRLLTRLFKKGKHRVIIIGRDEEKTKRVAAKVSVEAGNIADVAKANVVIVSVPIESTVEACREVLSLMSENTLLIEISSVKTGIVDKVAELVPSKIEYMSLHPLFGPSVRRLKGQNMIVIAAKEGRLSDCMIADLSSAGLTVEVSSVKEHDRVMATVQVMHHYAYLVMAAELAKMAKGNQRISRFLTRSLRRTFSQLRSLQRIRETVVAIQRLNPYGSAARRGYAESAYRMSSMSDLALSEIEQAMEAIKDLG